MSEPDAGGTPRTPPFSVSSASTVQNQTGAWKYVQPAYHDRVAPCNAGCPTGVDIQGYMSFLRAGDISAAIDLLQHENPMPAITGRVCNHPCEDCCNRGGLDGAVSIHAIERMLGDLVLQSPLPALAQISQAERVAVIGSGPAGLACAYHLTRLGYAVAIFEQEAQAGGMLRLGIPEYRLPRWVLDQQLARYRSMGIVIHTGIRLGTDVSLTSLATDFAAIFIATGAYLSKALLLEGNTDRDILLAGLDFLRAVNRGERPELGRHVIVIGGGNTAMDCARTALRLGAEVTHVVYRRTRKEMPAIAEEVQDAGQEGVRFEFLASPVRLLTVDGKLSLVCNRMMLDDIQLQGGRSLIASAEPPFMLLADTIITAIGEEVETQALPFDACTDGALTDEWGKSKVPHVFLGGDLTGETRTVATALGSGKRAAIGIDRYLRSLGVDSYSSQPIDSLRLGDGPALSMVRWTHSDPVKRVSPLNDIVISNDINPSFFERVTRHEDRQGKQESPFAETNAGLTRVEAFAEAERCYQCGVCNECELCRIYCSEAAISIGGPSERFVIDLDHCKGCGVCAVECPRGAIRMEHLSRQL